ncbi:HAMP domain-containing protein [Carboxylicivirga sediminis]|uniref:HAMP domain-containing protein n=1 Tax=Carboxylicivirga sediminis TaxID=2006564 RepID=A0A941F8A7_9BACT|nr:methyl-accepting chemotaxis protein [Carboxylicivirga sediminis]MBR8538187.1 HAMP domain-containing protein [Carboxylicivirga sediminis]
MQLRSIRSKILLSFGAVVFMVIAAVSFTFYYSVSNTLTENIRTQQLHSFLEASQSNLRAGFEKAIETSISLASDPLISNWFENDESNEDIKSLCLDKIDSAVDEFGYLTAFAVNNRTRNFWSKDHVLLDVISEDDPDDVWFFSTIKDSHKRIQTNLDFNRELNQSALFINVIMGSAENPLGVAGVGMNIDFLVNELTQRKFSAGSKLWVVDDSGIIKLAQDNNDINTSLNEVLGEVASEIVTAIDKGLISEYMIDDEANEIVYMNIGNTGHKIIMSVPSYELVSMLNPIRNITFVIGIIFLLLALTLAFFISRSLAQPILQLNKVAHSLSEGDLSVNIDAGLVTRADEIGQLAQTFSKMTSKISEVISQAKLTALLISEGGTKLTDSANELSSRSMQQATSTEEVSASMEEMGANISQNADNSKQTENIMSQAFKETSDGGEIVKRAVEGIKLIAEKVQIIEEIAMQTNILSLNAAVEAARAGEEGKGFAVVAAEVRKLAERSRESANEIREKATAGVDIAIRAGEIFESLVPDIQRAYNLVSEISAASMEQNEGSKQVNKAILELDSVSQGNAAAADKISDLSESFSEEVQKLNDVISFFKIKE